MAASKVGLIPDAALLSQASGQLAAKSSGTTPTPLGTTLRVPATLLIFALVSMVNLVHFAAAKPPLLSDVALDKTQEETFEDEAPSAPLAGHLNETPLELVGSGNPFVTQELSKCAKLGEYCENGRKCCRHLECFAYYRSRATCRRKPRRER
ncbi:unnamed protein product [Bemisia tabaci]|uniref:Uncharacterized protein n=1 Tax=Bemisia tabaci TaxID=7038 RepID=A0A9P0F0H6_BEMTA|nr:unnamed protein product [Bemisia tabaci]